MLCMWHTSDALLGTSAPSFSSSTISVEDIDLCQPDSSLSSDALLHNDVLSHPDLFVALPLLPRPSDNFLQLVLSS